MRTLKLKNGDLTFSHLGNLTFIDGDEALIQKLENRFKIIKGDLFYNMEYGTPLIKGKMGEEDVEVFISETIEDMEEIEDFDIINFAMVSNNHYNLNVIFYKVDGEELELEITDEIEEFDDEDFEEDDEEEFIE